jgi:hypothetical protein
VDASGLITPCSDAVLDATRAVQPVDPRVAIPAVLQLTSPASVSGVFLRGLSSGGVTFSAEVLRFWSVQRLFSLGVLQSGENLAVYADKQDLTRTLNMTAITVRAQQLGLATALNDFLAVPSMLSKGSLAGFSQPSGALLTGVSASMLSWARRFSSQLGKISIPRELTTEAGVGDFIELAVSATNAVQRTTIVFSTAKVGPSPDVQLRLTSTSSSTSISGTRTSEFRFGARAEALQCSSGGAASVARFLGTPSWTLELLSASRTNSSWTLLPSLDLATFRPTVLVAMKTSSSSAWRAAPGLLPAGRTYVFKISCAAFVSGAGGAAQSISSELEFTIVVSPTAGITASLISSAGLDFPAGPSASFFASVTDLDGFGSGSAGTLTTAQLSWHCFLFLSAQVSAVRQAAGATALSGGEQGSIALLNAVAIRGDAIPCNDPRALTAAASDARAQAIAVGLSVSPPLDLSSAQISNGGKVVLNSGLLQPGALILAVQASSGTLHADPPRNLRTATATVAVQLRSGPSLRAQIGVGGSGTVSVDPDGVSRLTLPQHLATALSLRLQSPAATTLASTVVSWRILSVSSPNAPVAVSLDPLCAVSAGQSVWSLLPVALRYSVAGAASVSSTWKPSTPVAFLERAAALVNQSPSSQGYILARTSASEFTPSPLTETVTAQVLDVTLVRTIGACLLTPGTTYEVQASAFRQTDGAAGAARIRVVVPAFSSVGSVDVAAAPSGLGPSGAFASAFSAAVKGLSSRAISFSTAGWDSGSVFSFSAFLPSVADAEELLINPCNSSQAYRSLLRAQRLSIGDVAASSASTTPLVALPVGSSTHRVIIVGVQVRSPSGATMLTSVPARQTGSCTAQALLVQSTSPVATVAAFTAPTSTELLARAQNTSVANRTLVDVSSAVSETTDLIANLTDGASGDIQNAIKAGDVGSAMTALSSAAALLQEMGTTQAAGVSSCLREVIFSGEQGPHSACSGYGQCVVGSSPSQCPSAVSRAVQQVQTQLQSAGSSAAVSLATTLISEIETLSCAMQCQCSTGRSGAACGLSAAAAQQQQAAKRAMLNSMVQILNATDTTDENVVSAAVKTVALIVSGDPTGLDAQGGSSAMSVLESITGASDTSNDTSSSVKGGGVSSSLAFDICQAAVQILQRGLALSRSAASATGGGRRLQAAQQEAVDAAALAFRAGSTMQTAATLGFVAAGGTYGDETLTVAPLSVSTTATENGSVAETTASLEGDAAQRLQGDARGGDGILVLTTWTGNSPYAAAAAASRLLAQPSDTNSTGGNFSSSVAADATLAVPVLEVSMLAGASSQLRDLRALSAGISEECLARAGGSTEGSLGVSSPGSLLAGVSVGSSSLKVGVVPLYCLSEPLVLTIPIPADVVDVQSFIPRWWSPQAGVWSSAGTIVLEINETTRTIRVATNHLTAFSGTIESVAAHASVPSLVADAGLLRNYLNPENLFTLIVICSIVGVFLAAWFVACRYDSTVREAARLHGARRALVLRYGTTAVPAEEVTRTSRDLQRVREAEGREWIRRMGAASVAATSARVAPTPSDLASPSAATSARVTSQGASSATAPTTSSPMAAYARFVCKLFVLKLRAEHPCSFVFAPPEFLVTFGRGQRIAVLGLLWLLSMAVSAAFFGKSPATIEIRAGVVVISTLCMLPATFLIPFVFHQIQAVHSMVRSKKPSRWAAWFRPRRRALSNTLSPAEPRPVASLRITSARQASSSLRSEATDAGHQESRDSLASPPPHASDVVLGLAPISESKPPSSSPKAAWVHTAAPAPVSSRRRSSEIVFEDVRTAGRNRFVARRASIHEDAVAAVMAQERMRRASAVVRPATHVTQDGEEPTPADDEPMTGGTAVDLMLLTRRHAELVGDFSPFALGPPGACISAIDVAAYFAFWCGVAVMGASAVLAVAADGPLLAQTQTPVTVVVIGVIMCVLAAVALRFVRKASRLAQDSSRAGHRAFLGFVEDHARPIPILSARIREFEDTMVTVGDLGEAGRYGLHVAYSVSGCCGCLGGAWLAGAIAVLVLAAAAQAVAAFLLLGSWTEPLTFEGCMIVAGVEAVVLLVLGLVLGFLYWDSGRSLTTAKKLAEARLTLVLRLQREVSEEVQLLQMKELRRLGLTSREMHIVMEQHNQEVERDLMYEVNPTLFAAPTDILRQGMLSTTQAETLLNRYRHRKHTGLAVPASLAKERWRRACATVLARIIIPRMASKQWTASPTAIGTTMRDKAASFRDASDITTVLGVVQRRDTAATRIQAVWRLHAARVAMLRLRELRVWERDLSTERSILVSLVYAMVLLLGLTTAYICLLFGVKFAPEQARAWLLTSFASFLLDLAVQKPVIIFANSVFVTLLSACRGRTTAWVRVSPNFVSPTGAWLGFG